MEIEKLWKNFRNPNCENCDSDCGKYAYDNLCSNINYLKNYGEQYYEKMKETFEELKKLFTMRIFQYFLLVAVAV